MPEYLKSLFSWGNNSYTPQTYSNDLDVLSQAIYNNPGVSAQELGFSSAPHAGYSAGSVPGAGPSLTDRLFGYANDGVAVPGLVQQGLGLATGIGNLYMGMQQYGLQKKMFEENQRQYNQNYAAQRTLTNARQEDRQRARVAANPGGYESVGDYMARNAIR